jgi:hypothetical protein
MVKGLWYDQYQLLPFSTIRIARNPYVDILSLFLDVASKAAITCNYSGLTYNKICLFFFFFYDKENPTKTGIKSDALKG